MDHSTVCERVFDQYGVKKLEPSVMYRLFCLGMFAQLEVMFAHRMTR